MKQAQWYVTGIKKSTDVYDLQEFLWQLKF